GVLTPPVSSRVQVDLAGLSHQGLVRGNNEDHYLVVCFERALQPLLMNLPEGSIPNRCAEIGYGMVVADGVGGSAAGGIASQMAISALVNLVPKQACPRSCGASERPGSIAAASLAPPSRWPIRHRVLSAIA